MSTYLIENYSCIAAPKSSLKPLAKKTLFYKIVVLKGFIPCLISLL